jgi:hypothetical protein
MEQDIPMKGLHRLFVQPIEMPTFLALKQVTTQAQADVLPSRVGSPYEAINSAVLHVNQELAKGFNAQNIQRLATEMEDILEQDEMLQTGSPTGNAGAGVAGIQ